MNVLAAFSCANLHFDDIFTPPNVLRASVFLCFVFRSIPIQIGIRRSVLETHKKSQIPHKFGILWLKIKRLVENKTIEQYEEEKSWNHWMLFKFNDDSPHKKCDIFHLTNEKRIISVWCVSSSILSPIAHFSRFFCWFFSLSLGEICANWHRSSPRQRNERTINYCEQLPHAGRVCNARIPSILREKINICKNRLLQL